MTSSRRQEPSDDRGVTPRTSPQAGQRTHHRNYCRWRAQQIAYGRWRPWADATSVSDHLRTLRTAGASYQSIARVAGVSPMTVHRQLHGERANSHSVNGRVRAAPAAQALIAIGHPSISLARRLGLTASTVSRIVRGATATVTPATHAAICDLYAQTWESPPPGRTPAECRAAAAARARAAGNGWPTPMGLDDDRIDDPTYRPRTRWRVATHTARTPWAGQGSPAKPAKEATCAERKA